MCVGEQQTNKAIENLVARPIMILIGIYMTASAIDPLLQLHSQVFRTTFTIVGGILILGLFFKTKFLNDKPAKQKENSDRKNNV